MGVTRYKTMGVWGWGIEYEGFCTVAIWGSWDIKVWGHACGGMRYVNFVL